jgi:hypothetical protein
MNNVSKVHQNSQKQAHTMHRNEPRSGIEVNIGIRKKVGKLDAFDRAMLEIAYYLQTIDVLVVRHGVIANCKWPTMIDDKMHNLLCFC